MDMPARRYPPSAQSLGARVIECRELLGLNQEELAERAGVNQGTLSLIESGDTKNPSSRVLINIAVVLGVTARYLMDGPPDGSRADVESLREIWDSLNPDLRRAWIAVGRAMIAGHKPPDGDHKPPHLRRKLPPSAH